MKNFVIPRRYAKALLLIGKEDGQAEQYGKELAGFVGVLDSEGEFEDAINNPLYPVADRQQVLKVVGDKIGVSDVLKAFLLLLFEKRRLTHLRGINEFYQNLVDEFKGLVHAEVTSAGELSDEAVEKIKASLVKMTGKEVVLDIKQDPSLIGGVMTKIGDIILDGSIKAQLLNMRESLIKGERV